jgi:urease accessory protein
MKRVISVVVALGALAAPEMASAHPGHGESSMVAGLVHPLSGADHLLALLLTGVAAMATPDRRFWTLPVGMLTAMAAGFGLSGAVAIPFAETLILSSLLVLGLAAALRLQLPVAGVLPVVLVFGFAHGAAHGADMPGSAVPGLFAAGFLAASATLLASGCAMARKLPAAWLRVLGAGSAGLGLLLTAVA